MKLNKMRIIAAALCAATAFCAVDLYAQSARLTKYDIFPDAVQNIEDRAEYTVFKEPASIPRPALSFVTGLPLMSYGTCSGAPVTSSLWSRPMFLSAMHCFPALAAESSVAWGAFASGNILGVVNPAARALGFYPGRGQFDPMQDFWLSPIKGAVSGEAHVYRLAKAMPPIGEKLTFWGYPTVGLPLLGGVAPLAVMQCTYLGPFLGGAPEVKKNPFTLIHAAQCPRKYFIKGMSGGPVVNADGEVVGTLSMATFPPKVQTEGTVLFFPEVTEARLNAAYSPGEKNYIAPLPDGTRMYSPVYLFSLLPSSHDPVDDIGNSFPVPEPPTYTTVRGNFEIPLKGQVVSGVVRAYADSGAPIDCARYENGQPVETVPCN